MGVHLHLVIESGKIHTILKYGIIISNRVIDSQTIIEVNKPPKKYEPRRIRGHRLINR